MLGTRLHSGSDSLERAVVGFAGLLLPGSDTNLESALESLLFATSADAAMIDRLEYDPIRGPMLIAQAQARRPGVPHTWVEFEFDESLEQFEAFSAGRIWVVPDAHAPGAPDRDAYLALDPPIRSELCIPILVDGFPVGQLSFLFADQPHDWADEEIAALSTARDIIQTVWARESSAQRLEAAATARLHSFRVTDALLACSQALLLGSGEEAVERALGEVLTASGATVVYLDENFDDPEHGPMMKTLFSAVLPSVPPEMFGWFDHAYPWSALPDSRARLAAGEVVVVESRSGMSPGDSPFYRHHEYVQSKIAAPVFVEGEWRATVGLLDLETRHWMPEHRRLVEAVATMFGAYWTREASEFRLRQALTSRDEFVASVSHELRTPLAAVVGFASELRDAYDEFDDETRSDLIRLIARQAGDVSFLVDDLLVAARSQQARLSLVPSVLDISSELAATLVGLPPEYVTDVVAECLGPVSAWADGRRVRQILRNLVLNARKYGGPRCVVRYWQDEAGAAIEVRDDGSGIPVAVQATMFEAYASGGRDGAALPSMGLGLTVSRQLAERMSGSLTYHFDGWSVFRLVLPAPWSIEVVE
jgi:signal transduction histidine kinase